jgi:speckle-type POZ protein
MADNNADEVDNNIDDVVVVETKIERLKSCPYLKSDNPTETLFSITFDNFKDLPSEKGQAVKSSEFSCFGSWQLSLYPGGENDSSDGMVGLFLERRSEGKKLALKYSLTIDYNDGEDQIIRRAKAVFEGSPGDFHWGWPNFCQRKEIIGIEGEDEGYLVKGALVIHVSMELNEFFPKNKTSSIMLKLFNDENSADVVFEICEQQQNQSISESDRKRARTSTAKLYHAHRLILQHYSSELSALCATSDDMTPIIITDVKPEVFRHLLYYVYGGEITEEEYVDNERDIINAADKYGVTNLKLEAEVWCVKNTEVTIENMIDTLLYAHAMNCALLKESVMDFILEHKQEVVQQVSFRDAPGDLCNDLLAAVLRHYDEDSPNDTNDDNDNETDVEKMCSTMRIRDLRRMLDD